MRRSLQLGSLLVVLPWACGPSEDRGPVHPVYLMDEDEPIAGAGAPPVNGPGGSGNTGDAGAPPVEVPEVPPKVTAMMPLSGPYGTEITIQGEGLGSAARSGVRVLIGPDAERVLTPTTKPEVVSWSESEIRFRFPFPHEGRVVVSTPLGDEEAGEFTPTWLPGPTLESAADVTSLASVSNEAGVVAAVLDTGPPVLVTCTAAECVEAAIPSNNLRLPSIRLYTDGSDLRAFGLSTATLPVIVDLGKASAFAQKPSSVTGTSDFRVAGGYDGATVWFRDGGQWSRAAPTAGVWGVDKGPLADVTNPGGKRKVAGATSDGSLYVAWGEDVGSITDDRGVAKHRYLAPTATTFATTATSGSEMDDEISNLVMSDRGAGLVFMYCGTDEDPFGISGSDNLCYAALYPGGSKTTMRESKGVRYAFGPSGPLALACSGQGLRLIPKLGSGAKSPADFEALAGDVVAWPCPNVVALEADPDGTPQMLVEHEGILYSPRPRE